MNCLSDINQNSIFFTNFFLTQTKIILLQTPRFKKDMFLSTNAHRKARLEYIKNIIDVRVCFYSLKKSRQIFVF